MSELRPLGRRHAWSTRFTGSGAIGQHMIVPVRRSRGFIGDPDVTMAFRFTDGTLDPVPPLAGPALTFTRNTSGRYYDAQRVLQTAAIDAPRFDHDPTTGTALGLLIEEQRENLCLQSESFNVAPWADAQNGSTTANQASAPDNNFTADRLLAFAAGSARVQQSLSVPLSSAVTFSCYLKADTTDWAYLQVNALGAFVAINAWFNLSGAGLVGIVGADVTSASIEQVANGWYRCSITFTSDAVDPSGSFNIYLADGDGTTGASINAAVFMWGAQVEAGAFPTSYIPTVAVPVTRGRDNCSTADVTWFSQSDSTFYAKTYHAPPTGQTSLLFMMDSGSNVNEVQIQDNGGAGNPRMPVRTAGSLVYDVQLQAGWLSAGQHKTAGAYGTNSAVLCVDRVLSGEDNTGSPPGGITRLVLGDNFQTGQALNGHIAEFAYANVRKSNAFLQGVT